MKLYVPACGDRIVLEKDWEFELFLERRNLKFAEERKLWAPKDDGRFVWSQYEQGPDGRSTGRLKSLRTSLPKGTILEFDRIYIRTFNKSRMKEDEDYDSITFKVILPNGKAARHQRFWVKRSACLDIEYSQEADGLYADRVKTVRRVLES